MTDISQHFSTPETYASLRPYIDRLDEEIELCILFGNVTAARRLLATRRRVFVNLTGTTPRMFLALVGETGAGNQV